MAKHERRPETFEAVQWSPGVEGVVRHASGYYFFRFGGHSRWLEEGDWIVTNLEGDKSVLSSEEFAAKYRVAE